MAGNVNPVLFLKNDHRAVEELFKRLESPRHADREGTVQTLVQSLEVHADIEEEILYPAVRRYVDGGRRLSNHATQEHEQVRAMLAELSEMDPDSSEARGLIEELHQSFSEHVAEEEGPDGLLAQLQASMDEEELKQMGPQLAEAKMSRTIENPADDEDDVRPIEKDAGGSMFIIRP